MANVYCTTCGQALDASARFCPNCGSTMPLATAAPLPPATGYAPPPLPVAVSGVRYGGFWRRVLASLIDVVIVGAIIVPIAFVLGMPGFSVHGTSWGGSPVPRPNLLWIVATWLYEAALVSSSYQATFGKMVLGMRVTDVNGQPLSFLHATGRHFAKYLSQLTLFIGYIMAGFTARKQALHDMVAGTLVVRK